MKFKDKKIAVLMGGLSKEREISLRTGKAVSAALKNKKYHVVDIDCDLSIVDRLRSEKIEAAFIALHGNFGEDGTIQGILEWLKIPYTGPGVLASALAMDKAALNQFLLLKRLTLPQNQIYLASRETIDSFVNRYAGPFPAIVKPSREGSTINVTRIEKKSELKKGLQTALESDNKILVEEFVVGKEITVSVLNGTLLPFIEIVPKGGFYDYQSKYTKGMTDYVLPARISETCEKKIKEATLSLLRLIDFPGAVRLDYIVDTKKEKPYFLEINTIPGMTETSLVPKAAAAAGISFDDLVETILEGASLKQCV